MPERCVSQVMSECDCLGEILIELKRPGYRARDLGYLQCVRHARAVMVTIRSDKDLCLILESSERFTVKNTVPVTLEDGPDIILFLRVQPSL